ncbi:hypothetical protein E2562_021274 [Oryza meyeriana var. granulata]|uniref:Uncharacterized protein n=1 Tax=Oryza meyeriana var. granulata TaxID=110450 RepID=A0A6G1BXU0_9ORYZ|nr:hypothetical protein E2562_021274 [Oryza meyeriana var. granulata]
MTWSMAHDTEAGGSSWPRSHEAPAISGPEMRMAGPEVRSRPGKGGARNPPMKKKKTAPVPEGCPFVHSQWGFTGPRPRQPKKAGRAQSPGASSALRAGATEGATAALPEANP